MSAMDNVYEARFRAFARAEGLRESFPEAVMAEVERWQREPGTDEGYVGFGHAASACQCAAGEYDDGCVCAEDFIEPPPEQPATDTGEQFSGGGVHEANAFACVDPQHRRRQRFEPPFCVGG